MLRGYRDLRAYQVAFRLAMRIFDESKRFPRDERFSLIGQMRRSSRSVAANIAEGYRKRQYPGMFAAKMADADAEATETQVWVDFALECSYLSREAHKELSAGYEELGKMLGGMVTQPKKFMPA